MPTGQTLRLFSLFYDEIAFLNSALFSTIGFGDISGLAFTQFLIAAHRWRNKIGEFHPVSGTNAGERSGHVFKKSIKHFEASNCPNLPELFKDIGNAPEIGRASINGMTELKSKHFP